VATIDELEIDLKKLVDQMLLNKLERAAELVRAAKWALFDHDLPRVGARLNDLGELLSWQSNDDPSSGMDSGGADSRS
jgi:hypothetical protein